MPIGAFTTLVSGFTSDHTYQTISATTEANDGAVLSLNGMTWNLLNQAVGRNPDREHANNPFDLDEPDADYFSRKDEQLKFLWQQMKSGTLDFILLQEVDLFMRDPLLDVVRDFLEKLRAIDWFAVHSDKNDGLRVPLLILFNTKKLRFVSKRSLFPTALDPAKNSGLEATFAYLGTKHEICITNLDLEYNTDHRQSILDYQYQKIKDEKFTILGGDANFQPGKEPYGLIGDLDMPTNIALPLASQTPDEGGKILIRLDGFMVGPACPTCRVEILEGPGAYFIWQPTSNLLNTILGRAPHEIALGRYITKTFDPVKDKMPHMQHISLPGSPWIRDKYKYKHRHFPNDR